MTNLEMGVKRAATRLLHLMPSRDPAFQAITMDRLERIIRHELMMDDCADYSQGPVKEATLLRGGTVYRRGVILPADARDWNIWHIEPFGMARREAENVMSQAGFVEQFTRLPGQCPSCECALFNSVNYMSMPAWFYETDDWKRFANNRRPGET